ncbi:MAG: S1/P1 nuclease [Gemmatimonadetes bacterium]|nr:S1/P1 nuclease [Gemmatimonadota bacterium]
MNLLLGLVTVIVARELPAHPPRWGVEGHRIVCEIAWQRLTPAGKALVGSVLADGRLGFVESCSWADAVRSTTHRHTAPYHFVNIPPGSGGFDMPRDCSASVGRCVTWAIAHYGMELQNADRTRAQRAEALKFLSHFVADLHQPLHAGRLEDLGGNRIAVRIEGSPCVERDVNLHGLWDSVLLCHGGLTWPDGAAVLDRAVAAGQAAFWSNADLVAWTNESFRLAEGFVYRVPGGGVIDRTYLARAVVVTREQLQRAGVRLAFLISRAAAGGLDFVIDANDAAPSNRE